MGVRCAGCLQPIVGRDAFVLADTEVFHKTARCMGLISRSVKVKLQLALNNAQAQIESMEPAAFSLERLEDRIRQLERDVKLANGSAETWRQLAADRLAQLGTTATAQQVDSLRAMVVAANSQRDGFREIAARLEQEIAQLRQPVAAPTAGVKKEADLDPAEVRSSLLELD